MKPKVRCLDCATHASGICRLSGRSVTPESFRNCKLFSSLASATADQLAHDSPSPAQQQQQPQQEQQQWESSAN